jgi:hypothetical protein
MPTPTSTEMAHRQAMVDSCNWSIAHRGEIHYEEARPMPIHTPINHPFTTDCSGYVTLMAKWAGCFDPNGLDFDGQGYTGTMLKHLAHIPFKETLRGDLLVIGGFPGIHVVCLLEGGQLTDKPQVASLGGPGDPQSYSMQNEIDYFGSNVEVTYLRLETPQ